MFSTATFGNTSYALPIIEDFTGEGVNSDTAGGQLIRIIGRDFGTVQRNLITDVYYGKINSDLMFQAQDCNVVVDHYQIECKTAQGAGKDLQWRVEIDHQISLLMTTDYAKPVIESIEQYDRLDLGETPPALIRGMQTEGNELVILAGRNFGPRGDLAVENNTAIMHSDQLLLKVTYGPTGEEYECREPKALTHYKVECKTSAGVGSKMFWKIQVHDQNSTKAKWWTQYNPPKLVNTF